MKMSYHRNNINKKRGIIAALFVLALIFVYFHKPILHKISSAASFVYIPVMKADKGVSNAASPLFSFFESKQKLKKENDILKSELVALELASISSKLLAEENRLLKEILGRFSEKEFILASVISKPNHSPYDTLILDVGEKDGIKENELVMSGDTFVIGAVSEVYGKSSKVTLFSNPGNIMQVLVGTEAIPAEAKGKGGGNFEIILPRDLLVKEEDVVTVPEMSINILGTVGHIKKDPNDSFQTILLRTPVNISELKWVQIVKSSI